MAKFGKKKSADLRVFKPKKKTVKEGVFEFTIESLSEDARGIARPQGKATFVRGALPNEKVSARYIAHHKQYDEAQLIDVIDASSDRKTPPCQHNLQCGGCTLQHYDYEKQTEYKQERLVSMFSTLSEQQTSPITWGDSLLAEPWAYRHRLRLAVKANKHGVLVGFRRFNSHDIVDVKHCEVAQPALNNLLPSLKAVISALKQRSVIEEVKLLEDGDGQCSVQLLVKKPLSDDDYEQLGQYQQTEKLRFISVSPIKSMDSGSYWSQGERLSSYYLEQPNVSVGFEIEDFTQVNPAINQAMVASALDWLAVTEQDILADFFCGVGNFSVPLATQSVPVVGYEFVDAMVEKGRENAARNQLDNLSFKRQDLFKPSNKSFLKHKKQWVTKALLDPPRAGAQMLVEQLAKSDIQRLVYISCNPQTLLRDAEVLKTGGFVIRKGVMVDMFPQTTHIETMMLFEKT